MVDCADRPAPSFELRAGVVIRLGDAFGRAFRAWAVAVVVRVGRAARKVVMTATRTPLRIVVRVAVPG